MGKPWNGDYVFSSGDLVEDLTHNFFLETGARNNKLKVYEMVDHPAARALTGYLLVRGGVHQVAYARALENLTGAQLMKLFPSPRIPTDKIPECKPHIKRGEHLKLYRFSVDDFQEIAAVFNGPHPETGEDLEVAEEPQPQGAPAYDLPPQTAVFAPGPEPEEIAEIAAQAAPGRRPAQGADRRRGQQRPGQEQRLDEGPGQEKGERPLTLASSRGGAAGARLPGTRAPGYPRRPWRSRYATSHRGCGCGDSHTPTGSRATTGSPRSRPSPSSRAGSASSSTPSHRLRAPGTSGSASRRWRRARSSS